MAKRVKTNYDRGYVNAMDKIFACTDNGGGYQSFEVRATDKQEAIEKGMKFAKKYACGDICGNWECKLKKENLL